MEAVTELNDDVNNQTPIDWDDLYFDLKNERAILVLGPEFYNSEGVSIK